MGLNKALEKYQFLYVLWKFYDFFETKDKLLYMHYCLLFSASNDSGDILPTCILSSKCAALVSVIIRGFIYIYSSIQLVQDPGKCTIFGMIVYCLCLFVFDFPNVL